MGCPGYCGSAINLCFIAVKKTLPAVREVASAQFSVQRRLRVAPAQHHVQPRQRIALAEAAR